VVHNTQRTAAKQPLEAGKTRLFYPDCQHIIFLPYSSEDMETVEIGAGIARVDPVKRGEIAVLARTRASLERLQNSMTDAKVSAAIARRRVDFRSAQFLSLAAARRHGGTAALRLAARPLDRRALNTLTGAFNHRFDSEIWSDDITAAAETSSRSLLAEWVNIAAALTADEAKALAQLASSLDGQLTTYRTFIEKVLKLLPPQGEDHVLDIDEDRAAWSGLVRSINQTLERSVPLFYRSWASGRRRRRSGQTRSR
jgi:DNA helicase II / ATP-dependent DNA helicase PcrA